MADSTTLRIARKDKATLKQLQRAWSDARGTAPSQQEVLQRSLAYTSRHVDDFLAEEAWTPPGIAALDAWTQTVKAHGPTSWKTIDDELYG